MTITVTGSKVHGGIGVHFEIGVIAAAGDNDGYRGQRREGSAAPVGGEARVRVKGHSGGRRGGARARGGKRASKGGTVKRVWGTGRAGGKERGFIEKRRGSGIYRILDMRLDHCPDLYVCK